MDQRNDDYKLKKVQKVPRIPWIVTRTFDGPIVMLKGIFQPHWLGPEVMGLELAKSKWIIKVIETGPNWAWLEIALWALIGWQPSITFDWNPMRTIIIIKPKDRRHCGDFNSDSSFVSTVIDDGHVTCNIASLKLGKRSKHGLTKTLNTVRLTLFSFTRIFKCIEIPKNCPDQKQIPRINSEDLNRFWCWRNSE